MAGTLHVALYVRRVQQQRYKYERQWLSTTNREFLWNHQTRDNIFWCLVSGCGVWTAYEALTHWFLRQRLDPAGGVELQGGCTCRS